MATGWMSTAAHSFQFLLHHAQQQLDKHHFTHMDAFFNKLASSLLFTSNKSVPAEKTNKVLLASGVPRSHIHSAPRSQLPNSQDEEPPLDSSRNRIAYWDKKREKCNNCQHIYLKTLSKHPGFCSVDCKSNMVYLEKVNRTIRAMKTAVQEQCRQKEHQQEKLLLSKSPQQIKQQSSNNQELKDVNCDSKTFAEFDLESRILESSNVEWAFSAMY
ncbi:uncharacterized protein PHALS_01436 [Plasmopara halstedii]|uniref:Uncharacterized protein n=1 Tax=Plasmopara halstedii TaxID=4781 RepID=A0A0P1AUT1_PLAHL|nr:uncharacterized protein PHALS_01436 [Plasmopara halstedii]CEG45113.1 hypothetical protein PHALS_01436 [Plasmopara halstedii]|eukprot:XP_024581482.1 hypothetical protein PHALS_01436 [Plasmopara halstedii]